MRLHDAVYELCWLLDRGYARHSAIQLVGDHHQLAMRQRLAISRAACSSVSRELRIAKCLPIEKVKSQPLIIDGFNLIITVWVNLGAYLVTKLFHEAWLIDFSDALRKSEESIQLQRPFSCKVTLIVDSSTHNVYTNV